MRPWAKARRTVLMDAQKIAEAREQIDEAVRRLQRTLAILDEFVAQEELDRGKDDQ